MRHTRLRRLGAVVTATGLLVGLAAAPAAAGTHQAQRLRTALTTKLPYAPAGSAYAPPPAGFVPAFTENVSRHGARTLTSSTEGDALVALTQVAQADGGLTRRGQGLGKQVQTLLDANAQIGYGLLTQSGKDELATTAKRMERRLPSLFHAAARPARDGTVPTRIEVIASSQPRTVESAQSFVAGLVANHPKLTSAIGPVIPDDALLYFHKSNAAYQNYLATDPRLAAAEAQARALPRTDEAARAILRRSFTDAFVDRLAAGDYSAQFADDVDAAQAVYDMWAVTADLVDEAPAGGWQLQRYVTTGGVAWFGYLDDLDSFYEKGPGFADDTITYSMASILLDDMFAALDAKRDGSSDLDAVLRFTHAEEIFPLADLLQLPGSTQQQPEGTLYRYGDNPFRGADVAPMAANVQWDLYRDGDTYLVRMLYNEQQTAFKTGCTPIAAGSYYYDLDELESCYGYSPTTG